MYINGVRAPNPSSHLQDTEFLRGLQRDLEATRASQLQHFARKAIDKLKGAVRTRERFCSCSISEASNLTEEPDSDPEDGWYCGLSDITEHDDITVLRELQVSSEVVPSSIIEGIRTRLELEEWHRQKKTRISRNHCQSPSLSSSPNAGSHTFIHGIELLPTELIYNVISFARQPDQHIHITLSQVNRFFRSLVNSSPLLWTKIDLAYPIPLISIYVERSARSPLEIIADNGESAVVLRTVERQDRTSECLALLRPHRNRIHSIRVRDGDAAFWGVDLRDMTDWYIYRSIIFPPVTNLRKLRLCGSWSRPYLPLFSPQLQSLALADCSVELSVLLEGLRCTPALEHLTLSDFMIELAAQADTTPVILHRLRCLSFIRCSPTDSRSVLQRISLPELSALTTDFIIEADGTGADHDVDVTGVELFTRAQPTIQQLDISVFPPNDTFLEAILQRLPGLLHLRIASASLRDGQLLFLSVDSVNEAPTRRVLCPQLTSLTIENEFDITSKAIRRIVESRHAASIPLKTLTLRGLDGAKIASDDIESLAAYGIKELFVDVFYTAFSRESDGDLWSGSEEAGSSEGEWLSGDEDVVAWGRYSDTVQPDELSDSESEKEIVSDEDEASAPNSPPRPCIFTTCSLQDLPLEIITQILFLTHTTDPHAHITISHVDASRRALVNSTPLLWSQIDYLYPLHIVYLYLERSGDVPLQVAMLPLLYNDLAYHALLQDFKVDETNRLKEFMRALRLHRHRIISLRLRCDDLAFDIPGENEGRLTAHEFLCDGSMAKLERLDVELGRWGWEGMKEVRLSSRIEELRIHGPWTMSCMPLFSTSLKSLVIAEYKGAPFSRILAALQAAPSLISLTIRDMKFTEMDLKEESILPFDHLESFSLIRIAPTAAEAFLGSIVAPNLVSIALHLNETSLPGRRSRRITNLKLSPVPQPSVQRVDLTACEGKPPFFASVFRTFPSITHLRIASSNISEQHLQPLLVQRPNSEESGKLKTACLNLKHLTVDNEFDEIIGVIREIALLRHDSGIPLESITLQGIPVDDDVYQDILKLREVVPQVVIGGVDGTDLHRDPGNYSGSETSSEGDWASGDEEVSRAGRKVGNTPVK
ncbi:hypothetical protein FS837_008356 [Tulasnella sp. UAMH 9824]|nr:hypothetical protein FS837_008356 [Tulasnella sp. UAMH 9824]